MHLSVKFDELALNLATDGTVTVAMGKIDNVWNNNIYIKKILEDSRNKTRADKQVFNYKHRF